MVSGGDDELVDAFLDVMEKHKMVVENAGLLTIAALNHLERDGRSVVSFRAFRISALWDRPKASMVTFSSTPAWRLMLTNWLWSSLMILP